MEECKHENKKFMFATMGIKREEEVEPYAPLEDKIMLYKCLDCKEVIL
jgi:hypothetical protein